MSSTEQVARHYCESCRARYRLPEAVGAPFGGIITATCEFCRRERECHVVEECARIRPPSEEDPNQLAFNWQLRVDRTHGSKEKASTGD
jgi:hypothetical protein